MGKGKVRFGNFIPLNKMSDTVQLNNFVRAAVEEFKNMSIVRSETSQRERLTARFAGRKISQPSADSDIMAANDYDEYFGSEGDIETLVEQAYK